MKKTAFLILLMMVTGFSGFAQRRRNVNPRTKPLPVVFAVINNGERIEPIGVIDKGAIEQTVGGDADADALKQFADIHYKPKTVYNLIFGGANAGTITVLSSDPKSDCSKNAATVTTQSAKAKLKGLVMGLATSANPDKNVSGVRRLPTPTERAEIEALVRAEFTKQKMSDDAVKNMKYHNLTAVDLNNDGKNEFIGSFWVENSPNERNTLFFIAERDKRGKQEISFSNFETIKKDDVMSRELNDLDKDAMLNELLLDMLEVTGDSTAEVFTVVKAFEGYKYNVYSKNDGKWAKIFDGSNYHCAY